jgi:hypothetical protein
MWRWCETRAVPLRDASGAVSEWIGTVADVHVEVEALLDAERVGRELEATLVERGRSGRGGSVARRERDAGAARELGERDAVPLSLPAQRCRDDGERARSFHRTPRSA